VSGSDADSAPIDVAVGRVYDPARPGPTYVLVDRLWPRGVAKDGAPFQLWCKDVAPSTQLRKWYGHSPERFAEFATRYRRELATGSALTALGDLRSTAERADVVLLTATRDLPHSAAVVLRDVLAGR
jgi:uncharacterized protein YeaO (DUF488 family)